LAVFKYHQKKKTSLMNNIIV